MMNGDNVIMVKYYVPTPLMNEQAIMQKAVLQSFELQYNIPRSDLGLESYRVLDVVKIDYPEDWKVYAQPVRTVDYMDVSFK